MLIETLTDAEENKIHKPEQEWSDSFAFKVASADFEAAEYSRRYHDSRWELADRLYFGWERQRTWEGTKIPRSSIGMYVVFQQIESLLPKILSSIFGDTPWFEVGPQPGTTAVQALAARDFILYQMEMGRRLKNQSIREVIRRAVKSAFIYGAGILEIGWLDEVRKRKQMSREQVPVTQQIFDPRFGRNIELPTGQMRSELREQMIEQRVQMPKFDYVSIKDFYIDPNCPSPQVQQARFACTRALMTVDQLAAKRKEDGFNIPDNATLIEMAKYPMHRQSDVTKAAGEAARGNNWRPNEDTSIDPAAKRIEVISYWTGERCVWIANPLDRAVNGTLYNSRNDYGFIPFFNAFYTDALDRFYGLSVTDVTEGEHRLQGGIVNARMDELSLTIHAARIKKRGASVPSYQLRRRPGQIIEAENPREDVVTEQTQNITQQAFVEVAASDARVQKTTGITDLAVMGTPGGSGNSANRTATGIGVQTQAAFSRLTYIVENIEDTFVEPLLSAWHSLNVQFLDPNELLRIIGRDIDPLEILNADVLFYMRASSKMQSRMALLQTFPLIAQTFMNPELIAALAKQGKTFDMEELWTMLLDMTGYKTRGQFIRALTAEEKQAMAAAQQAETSQDLIKQRERMAAMKEMKDDQADATLQNTIVKTGLEMALEPEETEAV